MTPTSYQIYPSGDNALTIQFGDSISLDLNNHVFHLYNLLRNKQPFIKDIIPGYCTLTIIYDLLSIRSVHASAFDFIQSEIETLINHHHQSETTRPQRLLKIPVCYHVSFAPDAEKIMKHHQVSFEQIIYLHIEKTYSVFMIGFLPGFAYMGVVDKKIATPRLSTPRSLVPAGSVGIAGEQTGIYPLDSPGGWNIIGRTPLKLFDIKKPEPVLFQPGDQVKFSPISFDEFQAFKPTSFNSVINES